MKAGTRIRNTTVAGEYGRITFRGGTELSVDYSHRPALRRLPRRPELLFVREYTTVRDLFKLLALATVVLLLVAILVFGEKFAFWTAPLSDLGTLRTPGGQPNRASFLFFALYMVCGSLIMVRFAKAVTRTPGLPHQTLKFVLAICAAAGYLGGIFPHDQFQVVHMISCGIMVGSLWMLGNVFTAELSRRGRAREALRVQAVLQASVLPYAITYLMGADVKQTLQKVAVVGLYASLTSATRYLRTAVLDQSIRDTNAGGARHQVLRHAAG